jgi:preprotein translocase SecE subunit
MDENKKKDKPGGGSPGAVKGTLQTYRAEFRKIVWPSKETLFKHTVTVIAVSLMFGAYIAFNDYIFGHVFRGFVGAVSPIVAEDTIEDVNWNDMIDMDFLDMLDMSDFEISFPEE